MVTETFPRRWLEEAALNRRWFDVIIFAGGKQYRAHKIILSSASPFLRGILLPRSSEEYSCIVLPDVSSETAELFLQYVYTGEVSLLREQVESFITLAKVLQLYIDKDMVCEDKHKHCEIDPVSVNHPHTNNSVLLNILSDVHSIQTHIDKDTVKNEDKIITKYENSTNKELDVEVLIKSDKISKWSMTENEKNFAIRQNHLLSNKYPKICEFYKKMQYFGRTNFDTKVEKLKSDTKNLTSKDDEKNCEDDECKSTSSCEVIDPVSDDVSSSNTKLDSFLNKNNTYFRQSRQHKILSLSPSNGVALNSVSNSQRSPDSQNCPEDLRRSEIEYRISSAPDRLNLNKPHEVVSYANHRLIKPIPSLMPIDRLGLDQNSTTSPALLDLSAAKKKLNRNVHSAFQEVSKPYIPSEKQHSLYHNYTKHNAVNTNDVITSAFHLRNSRLRINSYQTTDNLINSWNSEDISSNPPLTSDIIMPQDLIVKTKILPRNRAISGPWCSKSLTFFKPGRRTPISPQKHTQDSVDLQRNIGHSYIHQDNIILYQPPFEKSVLNVSERSNDSNNNFDTINCNNTVPTTPKTYHQLVDRERTEEELNVVYNKPMVLNSPRSISVSSSREEDVFKTPEDEYRNIVELNKYNQSIEPFSIVVQNELDSELNVKTEDYNVNDCEQLVLKCEFCAKVFTSKESLAIHSGSHSSRARYKCDQCDKCFSQLRNYKYHVSVHRGTKEFAATCNVCGKYFNDRGYLSSHMKIHRNRKEYQCPHCPKSFNQRVAYNMHVRIHTGIKPHQCEECGKAFSRKMLLKQHARTHSGEKPYACTSCGKRFADRSNMTLHMRLHSDRRPARLNASQPALRPAVRMQQHTCAHICEIFTLVLGVKPFSCTLCPKSFTKKHHLKTHLNYHTGNKPYACVKCGLTFSQSSNMRTHMKKCTLPDPTKIHEVQQHPAIQPELMAT